MIKDDNLKKLIIAAVFLIVAVIAVIAIVSNSNKKTGNSSSSSKDAKNEFVKVEEDGTRVNISSKLAEAKEFKGLKFTNIKFSESANESLLTGDVQNISNADIGVTGAVVTFLNKNGDKIGETKILVVPPKKLGEPLKPGESTKFTTSVTFDYVNAYDFKISEN